MSVHMTADLADDRAFPPPTLRVAAGVTAVARGRRGLVFVLAAVFSSGVAAQAASSGPFPPGTWPIDIVDAFGSVLSLSLPLPPCGGGATNGLFPAYFGNPLLPKVNVLGGDLSVGGHALLRLESGLGFIEGYAAIAIEVLSPSPGGGFTLSSGTIPGITGDLYLCAGVVNRGALWQGRLLGGLDAGSSPIRTVLFADDPVIVGARIGLQAYIVTEILTNPSFSQYTVIEIGP